MDQEAATHPPTVRRLASRDHRSGRDGCGAHCLAPASPLVDRVWRQVRDGLDRERLLPADDKRRRDLAKRLDKPPDSNGWATYVAGLAHTIGTGKARNRRNAEIALVEAVTKWTADVAELLPDRMAELRAIVNYVLHHPKQVFNQNR